MNLTKISIIFFLFNFTSYAQNYLDLEIKQTVLSNQVKSGRLFVVFTKEKPSSVFDGIYYPDTKMNPVFGVDVKHWKMENSLLIKGNELYGFPKKTLKEIESGKWFVQCVFKEKSTTLNNENEIKIFSKAAEITLNQDAKTNLTLVLDEMAPQISLPKDKLHIKYETINSKLLTKFWNKPISIGYQVVLPKSYHTESKRKYPVVLTIGGLGERFDKEIISEEEILKGNLPEMILIRVDSKAVFGDSYLMNSLNNGPYSDVLIQEIFPYLESKYRCIKDSNARFLTGTSTGGWTSLALQIFYPDFFNGVWSTCADPVDFRQLGLINIYEDKTAFINKYGLERPGMRDMNGEIHYTIRTEIWAENLLGLTNSYTSSYGQWGSWNAVFGLKDLKTELPKSLFNPETGEIDSEVVQSWKRYDLRLYLSENWQRIGEKLQGKLNLWMGTMDHYYLNNAMNLFDDFVKMTNNPVSDAKIHFICGEGHDCYKAISFQTILEQMHKRYEKTKKNE